MAEPGELPWEELHGNLKAFIGRRVRNPADVDDLVQRVLLQIVKGIGSIRASERLHAWVYRIARNTIADYYRAPAGRREIASGQASDLESVSDQHGAKLADGDDRPALRELAGCLAPLMRGLPSAHREAVEWSEIEGLPQAEAARRAGISLSGMKSRVQRGRQQLKAALDACCRVDLDRRGAIAAYAPKAPSQRSCGCDE